MYDILAEFVFFLISRSNAIRFSITTFHVFWMIHLDKSWFATVPESEKFRGIFSLRIDISYLIMVISTAKRSKWASKRVVRFVSDKTFLCFFRPKGQQRLVVRFVSVKTFLSFFETILWSLFALWCFAKDWAKRVPGPKIMNHS